MEQDDKCSSGGKTAFLGRSERRTAMNCGKAMALALGVQVPAYATSGPSDAGSAVRYTSRLQLLPMEQRNLFRIVFTRHKRTRGFLDELRHNPVRRQNPVEFRQRMRVIRSALGEMFDDHKRLVDSMTADQWRAAEGRTAALEPLRSSIQADLQGIDDELWTAVPDTKVVAQIGKKMTTALREWRQQHHRMAAGLGISF